MAAVVVRFGMAFFGFALVMLVLCSSVNGGSSNKAPETTSKPTDHSTTVKPLNHSTTVKPLNHSTTVKPTTHSSTVKPTNHSTTVKPMNHSTTVKPANHSSTVKPTTHVHGNQSSSTPTAHHGNHSTAATTTNKKPTPTPEAHGGDHSDRGKWVATGFAVFFLITTIVMTVLYCRQRKIYRELEGDSSLSRLI